MTTASRRGLRRAAVRLPALLALVALAACTTVPAEHAAALSSQDPKWHAPKCVEMRAAAATYDADRKPPMPWTTGMLLGPYGLGIAAASHEHQEKQRKIFVRDMHLACSSQPLPADLQRDFTRPASSVPM